MDGNWIPDENNPHQVSDNFGGVNSLLIAEEEKEEVTWEDIIAQLPNKAPEKFYQFFRSSVNNYELRFSWYPKLAETINLLTESWNIEFKRIGQNPLYEVFYCLFKHRYFLLPHKNSI